MPKLLGRSVYLTEFREDAAAPLAANAAGGACVFLSLHISEEFTPDYPARVRALCSTLNKQGCRILADVSKKTCEQFAEPDLSALAKDLGLWALRIDYGFTEDEICTLAAKIPVVVNASTTDAARAARIAAAGPLVMAMHNFYPRPETGLDDAFFSMSSRALQAAGLKVLAFIPGDTLLRGPLHLGLPTLEKHRNIAPSAAYCDLALNFSTDEIFVGDPGLSDYEAHIIDHFCKTGEILLPCTLAAPYRALYGRVFTCRPDSPAGLVRFQESREYSCFGGTVAPLQCTARPRGSLTMDNANYARYSGEIQLTRADYPADARVNVIGAVSREHLPLVDCIRRGARFAIIEAPPCPK